MNKPSCTSKTVSNDYYAQCVVITDDNTGGDDQHPVPTPAPYQSKTTAPTMETEVSPYSCGNSVYIPFIIFMYTTPSYTPFLSLKKFCYY